MQEGRGHDADALGMQATGKEIIDGPLNPRPRCPSDQQNPKNRRDALADTEILFVRRP